MRTLRPVPLDRSSIQGIGTYVDPALKGKGFTPGLMPISFPKPEISTFQVDRAVSGKGISDKMEQHRPVGGLPVPEILRGNAQFVLVCGRPGDWMNWGMMKAILVPANVWIQLNPEAPHAGIFAVGKRTLEVTVILPEMTWKNNCHTFDARPQDQLEIILPG